VDLFFPYTCESLVSPSETRSWLIFILTHNSAASSHHSVCHEEAKTCYDYERNHVAMFLGRITAE